MRTRWGVLLMALTLLSGCVTPASDRTNGLTVLHASSPAGSDEVSFAAEFRRGFVLIEYQAFDKNNTLRIELDKLDAASMMYAGVMPDGEVWWQGHMNLRDHSRWTVAIDSTATGPVTLLPTRPPGGAEDSAFELSVAEEGLPASWWIALAAAAEGEAANMNVTLTGAGVVRVHAEGTARLFTERDFTGASDARAGDWRLGGTTLTLARELSFRTANGTFLSISRGGGAEAEGFTLRNDTSTTTWRGVSPDGNTRIRAPGTPSGSASFLGIIADASNWTLSVEASARGRNVNDMILVVDVELPPVLRFTM